MRNALIGALCAALATMSAHSQSPAATSETLDAETLRHFQALVRMDTSDPPGNEQPAVDYLKRVLENDPDFIEEAAHAHDDHRQRSGHVWC